MLVPMTGQDGLSAAEQTIARVLDQLERLYDQAETAIAAHANPDEAFRFATDFARRVHAIHDRQEIKLRELREDQAVRIKQAEETELSLAKLAGRIGVSKSRADQIVKAATARAVREE